MNFLKLLPKSSRTRPIYELRPYEEVWHLRRRSVGEAMRLDLVEERIRNGYKLDSEDQRIAEGMVAIGLVHRTGQGAYVEAELASMKPNMIWLPNTLVTCTVPGEISPVRRLRSVGDLAALRLLVGLYFAQNLSADGGVNRGVMRVDYARETLCHKDGHVIWRFKELGPFIGKHSQTRWLWDREVGEHEDNPIWGAISTLVSAGLVSVVPHLVESADPASEIMHGLGTGKAGEDIERQLAEAAKLASHSLIDADMTAMASAFDFIIPVGSSQKNVQVVGIYRLTHKPRTKLTFDWYRRMDEGASLWLGIYKSLMDRWPKRPETLAW